MRLGSKVNPQAAQYIYNAEYVRRFATPDAAENGGQDGGEGLSDVSSIEAYSDDDDDAGRMEL